MGWIHTSLINFPIPSCILAGAHEPPKAAKERATSVPCKYKLVTYFRV